MSDLPALIFDLDGTLVDSLPDLHRAVNAAFARLDHQFSLGDIRGFVGNGAPMLISRAMAALGRSGDGLHRDLHAAFMADYKANPAGATTIYPGTIQALNGLLARGHKLALCTNKPEVPARSLLRIMGLARFFPIVVGGDSLPTRKPDPAPALACLKATGAARALFIGDSEVDAETATRAGMPFLLFTQGYRKTEIDSIPHTARFDHHDALPDLVQAFS
jgi:phosphoglycolate phosphatase